MDRSRTLEGALPAQRMCGPVLLVSAILFLVSDLGLAASDALRVVDTGAVPGALLIRYIIVEEQDASDFATRLLTVAGSPPESATNLHQRLSATGSGHKGRYLQRHRGSGDARTGAARAPDAVGGKPPLAETSLAVTSILPPRPT